VFWSAAGISPNRLAARTGAADLVHWRIAADVARAAIRRRRCLSVCKPSRGTFANLGSLEYQGAHALMPPGHSNTNIGASRHLGSRPRTSRLCVRFNSSTCRNIEEHQCASRLAGAISAALEPGLYPAHVAANCRYSVYMRCCGRGSSGLTRRGCAGTQGLESYRTGCSAPPCRRRIWLASRTIRPTGFARRQRPIALVSRRRTRNACVVPRSVARGRRLGDAGCTGTARGRQPGSA